MAVTPSNAFSTRLYSLPSLQNKIRAGALRTGSRGSETDPGQPHIDR